MQTKMDLNNKEAPQMSTNRTNPQSGTARVSRLPKGENGRPLCRRCSGPTPPGRLTFCSEACVHEWRLRSDTGYLRDQVFLRDRGVCCECRADTEVTRRAAMRLRPRARVLYLQSLGIPPHRVTFWDADHVVPVSMGGGECGIANVQTLCYGCHAAKTSRMAAECRRAKAAAAAAKPAPKPKRGPSAARLEAQRSFEAKQRQLGHMPPKGDAPC